MILHYLRLALRILVRSPFFSIINLLGLAVGFVVFFILWHYATDQLSGDEFHRDSERMYLLTWRHTGVDQNGVGNDRLFWAPAGFPYLVAQDYPELSNYFRIINQRGFDRSFIGDHGKEIYFSHVDSLGHRRAFSEKALAYADPNLFEFFSLPLLRGNASQVLTNPNAVVLSEKLAVKYFGSSDPVDKIILLNDLIPLTVTGVYANIPGKSTLRFDAVLSMRRIEKTTSSIDLSRGALFPCYFKLSDDNNHADAVKKIAAAFTKYCGEEYKKWEWKIDEMTTELSPLKDLAFEVFAFKSKFVLNIFRITAIVILTMAWINYINLIVSRNSRRLKELAARIAVGARSGHFIQQFVIESAMLNFFALLLAITFMQFLSTPTELLLNFQLPGVTEIIFSSSFIIVVVVCVSGILITGLYPALTTWNQTPRKLFGPITSLGFSSIGNWLTEFQFISAVILIAWIFGVSGQLEFILNKDLGFDKNHVFVVDLPFHRTPTFDNDVRDFIERISRQPDVLDYAISSSVAGDDVPYGIGIQRNSTAPFFGVGTNGGVDHRFISLYDIKLLAGRNFLPENPADKNAILVSPRVLQRLEIDPQDALGKKILVESASWTHNMKEAEIIGIISDYDRLPLFKNFGIWPNSSGTALTCGNALDSEKVPRKISIKVNIPNFEKLLVTLQSSYQESFPGKPFNGYFLDEHINAYYGREKFARNQILVFATVAIGISCLGLLGMMAQKVVVKTKEIGIRKVLGASISQIAKILLDTTIKQIFIAAVIGVPVAYYLTQQYLEKFTDRITIQWWHFLVPFAVLITIMITTISGILWKATNANPVESLRYE